MLHGLNDPSQQPTPRGVEAAVPEILDQFAVDPTLLILAYAFALALGFAVSGLLIRRLGRRWRCAPERGMVEVGRFRRLDLIGIGWILAIYGWLSLSQAAVSAGMGEMREISIADLWVSIGFQCFMAAMVIGVMAPRIHPVDWLGLRRKCGKSLLLIAPGSVVVMWIVFGMMEFGGFIRWLESLGVDTVQDSVRALQDRDDPGFLTLMRFSAVVVAPICEEIVFRAYLYGGLKRFCGPLAAAMASSLVFAAAHASAGALLPLALFGLLLVWMYERSGSIWAPIAAHACFNAATVVMLMLKA